MNDTRHVLWQEVSLNVPQDFDVMHIVLASHVKIEPSSTGLQATVLECCILGGYIWLELPDGSNVIYRLKQAVLEWCRELRNANHNTGWKNSEYDECMIYYCYAKYRRIAALLTHVDGIFLAGITKRKRQGCLITYWICTRGEAWACRIS